MKRVLRVLICSCVTVTTPVCFQVCVWRRWSGGEASDGMSASVNVSLNVSVSVSVNGIVNVNVTPSTSAWRRGADSDRLWCGECGQSHPLQMSQTDVEAVAVVVVGGE